MAKTAEYALARLGFNLRNKSTASVQSMTTWPDGASAVPDREKAVPIRNVCNAGNECGQACPVSAIKLATEATTLRGLPVGLTRAHPVYGHLEPFRYKVQCLSHVDMFVSGEVRWEPYLDKDVFMTLQSVHIGTWYCPHIQRPYKQLPCRSNDPLVYDRLHARMYPHWNWLAGKMSALMLGRLEHMVRRGTFGGDKLNERVGDVRSSSEKDGPKNRRACRFRDVALSRSTACRAGKRPKIRIADCFVRRPGWQDYFIEIVDWFALLSTPLHTRTTIRVPDTISPPSASLASPASSIRNYSTVTAPTTDAAKRQRHRLAWARATGFSGSCNKQRTPVRQVVLSMLRKIEPGPTSTAKTSTGAIHHHTASSGRVGSVTCSVTTTAPASANLLGFTIQTPSTTSSGVLSASSHPYHKSYSYYIHLTAHPPPARVHPPALTMTTIQNLKNFIRHGKQARDGRSPQGEATTHVSNVHAQQQRNNNYAAQQQHNQYGISDPNVYEHKPLQAQAPAHDYSAPVVDGRNVAAKAGHAAAGAVDQAQKRNQKKDDYDPDVLQRIVAEERESKGKLPRYPGLERWTLVEKMGDGAFSNVYRAKDNQHQHDQVAIKVVRKFEMNSTQGVLHPDFDKKAPKTVERANILKEVQIMRQLDHPNIVGLIDFSESRQYYYIVLELCPGGELFHQIVRLTYFSEELSRHVIVQVANALEYLHEEAGVVHRDIKPENLLFYPIPFVPTKNPKPKGPEDEDKADEGEFIPGVGAGGIGTIKIADFGLSKVIWDSQTMTPCGTVGYTAPEIVKDERYSKSVDMWALGCVLYTLLCGFPPFYDESIQVLTEKVARGQYTFLSPWWDDISKSAQDLVSHLLTVDPDKRYDIKQFLAHPWIRQTNEPTHAAADAPPLATPLYSRQGAQSAGFNDKGPSPLKPDFAYLDETPGAGRRQDFRSPGAVNLREVFDVGYSVHRQEEEGKRRKNFKQGYRGGNPMNSLNALDEEYDDDEFEGESEPYSASQANPPAKVPKAGGPGADVAAMEKQMRDTKLSAAAQARQAAAPKTTAASQAKGYGQHSPEVAAAAKRQVKNKAGAFELSLDNATLLGRRKKPVEPSGLRQEQVVQ
ncbi:hypothetical protein BAUCODRAFT_21612 [Baudoinia panamericana UAMH 10762]|uniref:Protein kinase domain-containing protein n=1 Tax=Baudoinia panamericana (strain UAMH 10762) TaxID=717646 RepID=M2NKF5_BAUPA|nr:uncharacterized protein BAUCODRAFT_21612 [Baudoinia panamericana UAMH 10762]EMC99919.1 hypothetical protein BAUCODRAFT_21612 [Baudoinia panamericana UAMH 10762]